MGICRFGPVSLGRWRLNKRVELLLARLMAGTAGGTTDGKVIKTRCTGAGSYMLPRRSCGRGDDSRTMDGGVSWADRRMGRYETSVIHGGHACGARGGRARMVIRTSNGGVTWWWHPSGR